MRRLAWRWLRPLVAVAILVVLGLRLGSEPVMAGLRAVSPLALAVAVVVTAATTWCCARRWSLIADRLGDPVSPAATYLAYYRSQLVNASLPLGVVGDVDRGVRHGLRAVAWERGLGQMVQALVTVGVLLLLPSDIRWTAGVVALVAASCIVAVRLAAPRQLARLLAPGLMARIVVLSATAVVGHLVIFTVAARSAGVDVPLAELAPIAALVLIASAVPTSVAGWGPREGVAAWAFAATGLGADVGLTVAVTFGVMSLVATLPGLVVLFGADRARARPGPRQTVEVRGG